MSTSTPGPTPPGVPEVDQVAVVIPPGEADALVPLLVGLIAHARRDGIMDP